MQSMKQTMKRTFAIILFTGLMSLQYACSQGEQQSKVDSTPAAATEKAIAENLNTDQFYEKLQTETGQIVDVRTPEEFAQGHLPDAINLDFRNPDFEKNLSQLDPNTPVFVYCASGNRSSQAMHVMEQKGFKTIYNHKGYFSDWAKKGYPVVK